MPACPELLTLSVLGASEVVLTCETLHLKGSNPVVNSLNQACQLPLRQGSVGYLYASEAWS